MAELPPNSAPEDTQQSSAPNGWELVCVGILRSEFGRFRSHALDKAMMQLSAEQAWLETRAERARTKWWQQVRDAFSRPGFALAMSAAVLLVIVSGWILVATIRDQYVNDAVAVCRIGDTVNAHWAASSTQLSTGDVLTTGSLRLESGVVELAFASGARVAVQGPVDFKVTGRNSMGLSQGKISAEVPRPARGFTVQTPSATAIDLGTRFGLNAKNDGSSEVDVFEGKVHAFRGHDVKGWDLTHDMGMAFGNFTGTATPVAPETSFPGLSRVFMTRPVDCGFESLGAANIGGVPSAFGVWSGPAFTLTGPVVGVRPAQGQGMLRFLAPGHGSADPDSVVWQLIDLRPARNFISEYGAVDLKVWGQFNRVAGNSHCAMKFRLSIAAFHGDPANAPTLWAARSHAALALGEKEFEADNNPATWEKIEAATSVSADADFAVIEIRAIAPKDVSANPDPFPGNFADSIEAKVCVPLRAASTDNSQ
jgi:hypothetical protein